MGLDESYLAPEVAAVAMQVLQEVQGSPKLVQDDRGTLVGTER